MNDERNNEVIVMLLPNSVRARSIRFSLAQLVAGCMIPVMLVAAILLYFYYERESSALARESAGKTRAISYTLDVEILGIEAALIALASSPHLVTGDLAAFDLQARDLVRSSNLANVLLTDMKGQQLTNTRLAVGSTLPAYGGLELLQNVITTQRTVVSDLFIGRVLNAPLISIGVPVKRAGALVYVLTASILPKQIEKVLTKHEFDEGQIVGVLDRSGAQVASNVPAERAIDKPMAIQMLGKSAKLDHGQLEIPDSQGKSELFVYQRSPTTGWLVYTELTHERLKRDLSQTLLWLIAATGLAMAVGLAVARHIGGRITATISALKAPALALGEGKDVDVPEMPIKEVNEIGLAIAKVSKILRAATSALQSSEARMRAVMESANDAIITVDASQTVVLFNAAASRMFDCPLAQAVGMPFSKLVPVDFREIEAAEISRSESPMQRTGTGGIVMGLRRGDEEFPLELSCSKVVESGAVFHTVIIRDVTARVRANAALERSNLDLQQFAYVASHDLRTPLRSIGGYVQILERNYADKLDDKGLALIHRTTGAVKRLEQLTEDLLSYARVNAEVRPFAPVHCGEMLDEVIQLMDAAIVGGGARVTCGELPQIVGDRTQLVQLFLNLIGNGIKYRADRSPVVHVSARRTGREWEFSVTDNGIGIDAKHHEKVFEVFTRLHTQQTYSGTGIGLAVCRRVVEGHGGKIWLLSTPGEGSTFRFTVPDTFSESNPV